MTPEAFVRAIATVTIGASPDELRVVLAVAERLRMGRDAYGQLRLSSDGRDWAKERNEEIYDALVYSALKAIAGTP